jgi:hypothetical protein
VIPHGDTELEENRAPRAGHVANASGARRLSTSPKQSILQLHSRTFLPLCRLGIDRAPRNATDCDFLDHALNIHSGLRSIIGAGHARGWMMWAGQPGNDAPDERSARFDLRAGREPPVSRVSAAAGGQYQPDSLGWTDPTTAPPAPTMRGHEIRIDRNHRIPVASSSSDRHGVREWLVPAALAGSIGLASIGMLGGYSFFMPDTVISTAPLQTPSPSPGSANASKGDRLPVHRALARETDRQAPASAPHRPKPSSSTAIARPKPPPAVSPPTPSADYHPAAPQPPALSPTESAAKPSTETPLAPVPETRPTTIDRWTLREVVDGTAVLEGPGGVWRVKRGDSVPGVGKVIGILRWGNRLIVATSRGLISTP